MKFPISENFRDSLCTYVHTYNGIALLAGAIVLAILCTYVHTYNGIVHMYVCTQWIRISAGTRKEH